MNESLKELLDLRELGGNLLEIRRSVRAGINTAVFTPNLSERVHISSSLDKKVLFVTSDKVKAREVFDRLSEFSHNVGLLLERDDLLMYRKFNSLVDSTKRNMCLLGMINNSLDIVVTTSEAMLQYFPNKDNIKNSYLKLDVEQTVDIKELLAKLVSLGYNRVDSVEEYGDFSLKGDIVSIFPEGSNFPLSISFFDDVIESIKSYDLSTRKSISSQDYIELFSKYDPTFIGVDIENIISLAKKCIKDYDSNGDSRFREILSDIESSYNSGERVGYNWLQPLCLDSMSTIEDYLSEDYVIVLDEPKSIFDHASLYYNDFTNRHKNLFSEGEVLKLASKLLCNPNTISGLSKKYPILSFASLISSNPIFEPKKIVKLDNTPVRAYYANISSLYTDIRAFNLNGVKVVLCCGDEYTARNIQKSLTDNNIYATYSESVDINKRGVEVTPFDLSYGVNYAKNKLVVIGKYELYRKREKAITTKRKKNVFTMPKVGDYVVHDYHGIGICSGVEQIETFGVKRDFVVISYLENDKLYIPVDQMDKLQRYSGSDVTPKLNRLGGKEFQKLKDKVKASVKEMAFDLLELYKTRQESKGYKYPKDSVFQEEFEDAFPYEETDDQLKAINDIKSDMERGIVMDRLICGDVGYGKTEVALRAIFKTVMENKQAAILAPTTILARQHYITATERFSDSGIKCVLLSRFQSKEEIKKSLEEIKSGTASVIIATHRLLSSDVEFHDLGLLVLDEEQRFGVEHKEKLKVVKNNINVLTLSATPIPRTLNMALTGIRDISVLETPPKERIPVSTYVCELTDGMLSDVISRELNRGGQVYVLYNRVNGIERVANKIMNLVPEAKVIVGHGQMEDKVLERTIDSFYKNEANVLVCTTIIENGINLPNANTLIVCDADRLGLSQLYQLRGRVGRSNIHAYAYFTTPQGKALTSDAYKRLNAIMDYTELGSGFKIAMRDLEIRGAGNVLGKEQHGHIAKVGYDMYCKLLKEVVDEISGKEAIVSSEVDMKVEINAYLDSDYIPNSDDKIRIYKNIAELSSTEEIKEMIVDLTDRYGAPSESLVNLMRIAVIKNMASKLNVTKVVLNSKGMALHFSLDMLQNERIISAISDMENDCVLSISDAPIVVFNVKNLNIEEKLILLLKFLQKSFK